MVIASSGDWTLGIVLGVVVILVAAVWFDQWRSARETRDL